MNRATKHISVVIASDAEELIHPVIENANAALHAFAAVDAAGKRFAPDSEHFGFDTRAFKHLRHFPESGKGAPLGVWTAVDENNFHQNPPCLPFTHPSGH